MKTGNVVIGLATALGVSALAATPGLAQEVYVRSAQPVGPGVVVMEQQPVYAPPPAQVIVREAPTQVIVREAPQRVIVTEPAPTPMPRQVYVREALPPAVVTDEGYGCRTLERPSISGITTVSTVCD